MYPTLSLPFAPSVAALGSGASVQKRNWTHEGAVFPVVS